MLGTSGVLIGSNRNGSAPSLSILCTGQFFWGSTSPSFTADLSKHTYYVDTNKLYIDDVLKATSTGTWSDSHIIPSLGLFIVDQGTSVLPAYNSTARCYSLQIWDNDVLQMNMVPAKDSNNVVGMYDLVSGQFFTNEGTGDFTAGSDVVPSPDTPVDIVCNNGAIKYRHQSGLPLGYTLLDYIESTGTQYINTGVAPTQLSRSNTEIFVDGQYLNGNSYDFAALWGAQTSSVWLKTDIKSAKQLAVQAGGPGKETKVTVSDALARHTIILNSSADECYIDNNAYNLTVQDGAFNLTNNITLFKSNGVTSSQYATARIYKMYIKSNGSFIRNFIPAQRNSDNVVGMYDLVSGQFFTNAGTGDFVAGNVINDLEIYTDGTVETVTDSNGLTATCQRLLSVDDFKDTQEILSGVVTRSIGIKVMTGDETFQSGTNGWISENAITDQYDSRITLYTPLCTHFIGTSETPTSDNQVRVYLTSTGTPRVYFGCNKTIYDTADTFKQFFKDQYANGTPVIITYPLATATTETVTPQVLQKEPVTQTAGAISGLDINSTSSSHTTPTPQQPLQINCNNGVVKLNKNLYTTIDSVHGYFISVNGAISANDLFLYTKLIQVKAGKEYVLTGTSGTSGNYNRRIHGYNNGVWVEQLAYQGATDSGVTYSVPFTIPSTVNEIRVSLLEDDTNLSLKLANTSEVYVDGTTETVEVIGKNLFDKNHLPARIYAYFANSGTSWLYASSGYSLRFPCLPNTTYTARYNGNSTQTVLSFASTSNDTVPTSGQTSVTVTQAIRQNTPTINTPVTLTTGANDKWLIVQYNAVEPENTNMADNLQIELGSTATTYEPYYYGGSATAQDLYAVGDYKDVQSVLDGAITRNVGVKVFDGTETWVIDGVSATYGTNFKIEINDAKLWTLNSTEAMCNKFNAVSDAVGKASIPTWCFRGSSASKAYWFRSNLHSTTTEWTNWLKDQYNSGNPVIVIYPLATATTESATAQPLTIQAGSNIVEITQASMDNLELEVMYKAGVEVTITEVQNAQLDNNVEVTIQ